MFINSFSGVGFVLLSWFIPNASNAISKEEIYFWSFPDFDFLEHLLLGGNLAQLHDGLVGSKINIAIDPLILEVVRTLDLDAINEWYPS